MVVDNFFTNFHIIKDEFKKIKRYPSETHPELKGMQTEKHLPGERSEDLKFSNRFLTALFLNEFRSKFNNFFTEDVDLRLYTHLRLEEDDEKDFIHTDSPDAYYSMLVYLSDTNFKSGTAMYEPLENNLITDIKFVQNRAVIFNSLYPHKSIGCHGSDENNGRLTLNAFWQKRQK